MSVSFFKKIEDAPPWLDRVDIEPNGEAVRFTMIRRSGTELGHFDIPIAKLEQMIQLMKED